MTLHAIRGAVVEPDRVGEVAIPAYDALTPAARAAWRASHPRSYLHVLPDADTDDDVLARCRAALDRLRDERLFVPRDRPFVAVYRLGREGRSQTGLVADLDLRAFPDGRVHAHERTRRDREDDLVAHLLTVGATSSPVCVTHAPDEALRDALAEVTRRDPDVEVTDTDEVDDATSTPAAPVTQALWVVDDPDEVTRLLAAATDLRDLVVTDGHHRAAAAGRAAALLGTDAARRLMVALFPCDELAVAAFDRVLAVDPDTLVLRLRAVAPTLEPGPPRRPSAPGRVVVATSDQWWEVALPDAIDDGARQRLDVVRLQHLLAHVADVVDPRGDPRLDHLPGIGTSALVDAVADGEHVGFALWPTGIDEIVTIATSGIDEIVTIATSGGTLPPKSTYVIPKARSGLLLVPRDEEHP